MAAIELTMPVSVPCPPCSVPCQKPRPGQACSTAMPRKNRPMADSTIRPSRAERQVRSGSAMRAPAVQ